MGQQPGELPVCIIPWPGGQSFQMKFRLSQPLRYVFFMILLLSQEGDFLFRSENSKCRQCIICLRICPLSLSESTKLNDLTVWYAVQMEQYFILSQLMILWTL
jgi:ferredoxin